MKLSLSMPLCEHEKGKEKNGKGVEDSRQGSLQANGKNKTITDGSRQSGTQQSRRFLMFLRGDFVKVVKVLRALNIFWAIKVAKVIALVEAMEVKERKQRTIRHSFIAWMSFHLDLCNAFLCQSTHDRSSCRKGQHESPAHPFHRKHFPHVKHCAGRHRAVGPHLQRSQAGRKVEQTNTNGKSLSRIVE